MKRYSRDGEMQGIAVKDAGARSDWSYILSVWLCVCVCVCVYKGGGYAVFPLNTFLTPFSPYHTTSETIRRGNSAKLPVLSCFLSLQHIFKVTRPV